MWRGCKEGWKKGGECMDQESCLRYAREYMNKGDYDKAIDYFNEGCNNKLNMPVVHDKKEREDNCKIYFSSAYNNRANASAEKGKNQEAINDYTKAIELNSENADAWHNRAVTYRELGEKAKAVNDFKTFLKMKPDSKDRLEIDDYIKSIENEKNN
jgi:tetratricopeptide (TPR) repeat protein